jgi:hypothetical protein
MKLSNITFSFALGIGASKDHDEDWEALLHSIQQDPLLNGLDPRHVNRVNQKQPNLVFSYGDASEFNVQISCKPQYCQIKFTEINDIHQALPFCREFLHLYTRHWSFSLAFPGILVQYENYDLNKLTDKGYIPQAAASLKRFKLNLAFNPDDTGPFDLINHGAIRIDSSLSTTISIGLYSALPVTQEGIPEYSALDFFDSTDSQYPIFLQQCVDYLATQFDISVELLHA